MKVGFLENATLEAMESYLSRLSKRQQVISSNLANIDTPGYKAKDVSFHAAMEELIAAAPRNAPLRPAETGRILPSTFVHLEPEVYETSGLPLRNDNNNVNLESEMLKLGQTSFGYSMTIQLLRSKFRIIASSINEGRAG